MLGKLLKHECKATIRTFLPLYGALIIFACLNKAFFSLPYLQALLGGVPKTLFQFLYVAICVAVIVMSLIVSLQRFHKNLLGSEGYLMFTLPASPWQLITSKLLLAVLWTTLSTLLIIACSLFMGLSFQELAQLPENIGIALRLSQGLLGMNLTKVFFEVLGTFMLSYAYFYTTVYAAMSIGQLFTRHRVFLSFVFYGLISLATQIILTRTMYWVTRTWAGAPWLTDVTPMQIVHIICGGIAGVSLLFGGICFFLSNWLLKRHLNLL